MGKHTKPKTQVGQRLGTMTVIEIIKAPHCATIAKMQCDCGSVKDKLLGAIRFKTPKFCGPDCALWPRSEPPKTGRTGRGKWTESERAARALCPPVFKRIDTSVERFQKYANQAGDSECWLWSGGVDHNGYGVISVRRNRTVKLWRSHRFSWTLANGEIPAGMSVLHRCDTPRCVNPAHLWLGTQLDNMKDRANKGRGNHPRGRRHYKFKLSDQDVLDIRVSNESGGTLAERYNTSVQYISNIRNRKVRVDAETMKNDALHPALKITESDLEKMRMTLDLSAADEMARICDEMVRDGRLDARSRLADARLSYGEPWKYEWTKVSISAQKKTLDLPGEP